MGWGLGWAGVLGLRRAVRVLGASAIMGGVGWDGAEGRCGGNSLVGELSSVRPGFGGRTVLARKGQRLQAEFRGGAVGSDGQTVRLVAEPQVHHDYLAKGGECCRGFSHMHKGQGQAA